MELGRRGIRVCVVGGSGYTGGELLRYLALHREAEVVYITSREHAGKPVHLVHPNLRGFYKGSRFEQLSIDRISRSCDAVFFATPLEASLEYVPKVLETGILTVDLSPAFRLKDGEAFKKYYGLEHPAPDLAMRSVYGLPEIGIYRERLRGSKLIASPGCNATAAILSLYPLASAGSLEEPVIVDVKAGSSEAGAKPTTWDHHPERASSARPYSPKGHRHVAEVFQVLKDLGKPLRKISMVPHSIPLVRGILSSTHAFSGLGEQDLARVCAERYSGHPFVRLLLGSPSHYPDPRNVVGTNFAEISVVREEETGRISVFVAMDNLGKGAAGQAIQAFNLALGLDEREGLWIPPLRPV